MTSQTKSFFLCAIALVVLFSAAACKHVTVEATDFSRSKQVFDDGPPRNISFDVYFDEMSSKLSVNAESQLDYSLGIANKVYGPEIMVFLEGNSSSNEHLVAGALSVISNNRVNAVADWYRRHGIQDDFIFLKNRGAAYTQSLEVDEAKKRFVGVEIIPRH